MKFILLVPNRGDYLTGRYSEAQDQTSGTNQVRKDGLALNGGKTSVSAVLSVGLSARLSRRQYFAYY